MAVVITGNNTPTAGGITYGDGSTYANTAAGTSGQLLQSNGASAPTWVAAPTGGFTLGTPVATTSGTSIDFTGIPAGTKQIVISFKNVSLNSTSQLLIQLGDAGGIETTSYTAITAQLDTVVSTLFSSTGFRIRVAGSASNQLSGSVTLILENSTTFSWAATGIVGDTANNTDSMAVVCGVKSLSATLDRVRITTANGTDTFDAGEINIAYI
jgi:hypothetical protein